ncbi:MAG: hypothetical protein OEY14_13720 [Myxococcales bacterium]|nr:hypothetical protein [Myxococcales bacterium]
MPRRYSSAALLLLLSLGCEAKPAPAPAPPPERGPEYAIPLGEELFARFLEKAHRMEPEGEIRRGALEEGRRDTLQLILTGVYCYKILALGGEGVEELDLILYDGENVPLLRDREEDRRPTLGIDEPICPFEPGTFRLDIQMARGSGNYVLRVYKVLTI